MDLITAALAEMEERVVPAPPLIEARTDIPDPRRQGRHVAVPVVGAVLAVPCSCGTLDAVGQWCMEQPNLLTTRFPTSASTRWRGRSTAV